MPVSEVQQRFKTIEDDVHDLRQDLHEVKDVHLRQAEDIAIIRTVAEKLECQVSEMKNQPYKIVGGIAALGTAFTVIIGFLV